jgi:uncharacterized protein YkwD
MIRNGIRKIGVLFVVLAMASVCALPAYACWEEGIQTAPMSSAESETEQSIDFEEEYIEEVLRLINVEREGAGLEALQELDTLTEPADIRASESSVLFAHERPNGSSCATAFSDYNLTYSAAGENLAFGFNDPSDLVKAWMNSQSHQDNILSNKFAFVGIGFYQNSQGIIYCSVLFYTPETPFEVD